MEKFRSFEDPATGIMPFMPHKAVVPKNLLFRLIRGIIGLGLALVRLPFLLVFTSLLVLGSTVRPVFCELQPL